MALKFDISKTYDKVEWVFLSGMMEKMGFSTKWINLVMSCITSISYFVLINGRGGPPFYLQEACVKVIHLVLFFFSYVVKVYLLL